MHCSFSSIGLLYQGVISNPKQPIRCVKEWILIGCRKVQLLAQGDRLFKLLELLFFFFFKLKFFCSALEIQKTEKTSETEIAVNGTCVCTTNTLCKDHHGSCQYRDTLYCPLMPQNRFYTLGIGIILIFCDYLLIKVSFIPFFLIPKGQPHSTLDQCFGDAGFLLISP